MKSHLKIHKKSTNQSLKKPKQLRLSFAHTNKKNSKTFGGETLVGKRKTARPLSHKNPIHLVIKLKDKNLYKFFIRQLTSKMAQAIWKKLPHLKTILSLRSFTRILEWGKDFGTAINYVILNIEESMGWIIRDKAIKKSVHMAIYDKNKSYN